MRQAKNNNNNNKGRMEEKAASHCQEGARRIWWRILFCCHDSCCLLSNSALYSHSITVRWLHCQPLSGGGSNRLRVPYLMKRRIRMLTLVWRANWPQARSLENKLWNAEGNQVSRQYVTPGIAKTYQPLWESRHSIIIARAVWLRAQHLNIWFILRFLSKDVNFNLI